MLHVLSAQAALMILQQGTSGMGADDNIPTEIAKISVLSSYEFWLSLILLLFGLAVVAAQLFLLYRWRDEGSSIEDAVRLSIVTLIVIGAMILIAAGYSSNQIAPAMGLFGTIAGYLIGRQERRG